VLRKWISFALALAAVAIVAGCGSSGSGSISTVELTKAAFIRQGDEICEKTDKRQSAALKAYLKEHPKAQSSKAGQEELVKSVGLPLIQTEVDELAALGAPSADEQKIEAILKGIEKAVAAGEAKPGSLLTIAGSPFAAVDKLAGEYGFKACNNAL
jgi:hypothetical protein